MKFLCALLAIGLASRWRLAAANPAPRSTPLFFIRRRSASASDPGARDLCGVYARWRGVSRRRRASCARNFEAPMTHPQMHGRRAHGPREFLVGQDPSAVADWLAHASGRFATPNLYPGIDLIYSGIDGRIKSEYRVAAGADPGNIHVEYSADLSIDVERPAACRELDRGRARDLPGHARRAERASRAATVCSTRAPPASRSTPMIASLPLVIDPVISYATYMGGTGLGAVTGVALDSAGNLYAAGWTEALNFPHRAGRAGRQRGRRGCLRGEAESLRSRTALRDLHWRTRRRPGRGDRSGFERRSLCDRSDQLLEFPAGSCRCAPRWADRRPLLY